MSRFEASQNVNAYYVYDITYTPTVYIYIIHILYLGSAQNQRHDFQKV